MRILWSVPATKRLHQANDLAAFFKPRLYQRHIYEVRQQRICCDENVPSRNQDPYGSGSEFGKKHAKGQTVCFVQDGESRKRTAFAAVERRRNSPNSAAPSTQFLLLDVAVFLEAVWRIGDDRVNGIDVAGVQPGKGVGETDFVLDCPLSVRRMTIHAGASARLTKLQSKLRASHGLVCSGGTLQRCAGLVLGGGPKFTSLFARRMPSQASEAVSSGVQYRRNSPTSLP